MAYSRVERLASDICRDVCELPDRTSPDDWPEACLVTPEELQIIVSERLREFVSNLHQTSDEASGHTALLREIEAYRTMDASGSPTAAEVVGWNWIGDLAQQERAEDAALLVIQSTPVEGGGKVTRLYRSTTLLAVATTFRDDMNFTVLVRWLSPELRNRAALSGPLAERGRPE